MTLTNNHQLRDSIIEQAKVFGATSAGIARPKDLKTSSSDSIYAQDPYYDFFEGLPDWPDDAFRNSAIERPLCQIQMKQDEDNVSPIPTDPETVHVRYCRACEFSCPVGR